MGLILDTTVLIAAERKRFDLAGLFAAHKDEPVLMAAITASELLHGVERASTDKRQERSRFVEGLLASIEAVEFDLPIARRHAAMWAHLESSGTMIGAHDLQIAVTALHHGHGLATLNVREFKRIRGLSLADTAPYRMS
ncbi:MAG TPA: type II toxin-antitoxin system VapC family toxin [Opitutaceae bacterium]